MFSTAERAHRLDGFSVSWLVTDTPGLQNEGHRDGVTRFWSLFVGTQGGKLISYSPDMRTVFARIFEENTEAVMLASPAASDSGVIMHSRVIERVQGGTITNSPVTSIQESVVPTASAATSAPVTVQRVKTNTPTVSILRSLMTIPPAPAPVMESTTLPTVASGNTGIGIVWQAAPGQSSRIDLDLYVQPPQGGPELFFGCTNSNYGHFYRDLRQSLTADSRDWESCWEFVELNRQQTPNSVWVNLYSGRGPVRGRLRVQQGNRTYMRDFTVRAGDGNRGANRDHRALDSAWVEIRLDDELSRSLDQ